MMLIDNKEISIAEIAKIQIDIFEEENKKDADKKMLEICRRKLNEKI